MNVNTIGKSKSPKVSIIVNTCDRPGDLANCLKSLMEQTYKNFEILVIDNSESDINKEISSNYPVRVVKDKTKKLSHLFNLGWKNVENELIAYIADDAEADPAWLENIVRTLVEYPNVVAVGGPTISHCQPAGEMHRLYEIGKQSIFIRPFIKIYEKIVLNGKMFEPGYLAESGAYSMGAAIPKCLEIRDPLHVDLLTTTSMGIKRSVLEQLGGFDEDFFFNHADGDLFVRIKKTGHELIFNPKVKVIHHVRLSPSRSPYFIGRDTAYFLLKDIRPKSVKDWIGYLINIIFLNAYWIYNTFRLKDVKQLQGISGFVDGVVFYVRRTKNEE